MWPVPTKVAHSVVSESLCWAYPWVSCAKTAEPFKMLFVDRLQYTKEPCIRWGWSGCTLAPLGEYVCTLLHDAALCQIMLKYHSLMLCITVISAVLTTLCQLLSDRIGARRAAHRPFLPSKVAQSCRQIEGLNQPIKKVLGKDMSRDSAAAGG